MNTLEKLCACSVVDQGWNAPFVGGAADALWEHICYFYSLPDERSPVLVASLPDAAGSSSSDIPNHRQKEYYAQYCVILQSSGMGKSRAVDEISKDRFVIPVVLRDPHSTGMVYPFVSRTAKESMMPGHPPSDHPAFEYLSQISNPGDSLFIVVVSFMHYFARQPP